jgi:Fur family transcriptional regulator, ferric uptake regulator
VERLTRQRLAILDALRASGRSLSPPELLELAQRQVPTLSLSTVYRQLKALQDGGQIGTVELPGQPPRFELVAPTATACPPDCDAHGEHHHDDHGDPAPGPGLRGERHRHHFHCTACDEVTPIQGCPGGIDALAPAGWQVERHDLTLHGRCGKCLAPEPRRADTPFTGLTA